MQSFVRRVPERSVTCLPLTRSAMRLVHALGARQDLTVVGSPEQFISFDGGQPGRSFMTPLEVVRSLRQGVAPSRLISFPELLGGEGPSSIAVEVDGVPCRFSSLDARLLYGGYRVFCQTQGGFLRASRLAEMTDVLRSKVDEAAIILEINRVLGVSLVSARKHHLYPTVMKRKTAEGFAMGAADHARDMIGVIRLICAAESTPLPQELINGLSRISRMEARDHEPDTEEA